MNKQIEEIKDCIDSLYGCDCMYYGVDGIAIATVLTEQGYRRQGEVAREIFDELKAVMIDEYRYPIIAELKKKYIGEQK